MRIRKLWPGIFALALAGCALWAAPVFPCRTLPAESALVPAASSSAAASSSGEPAVSAPEEEPLPASYVLRDFPIVYQLPELPTGCEITALAMVLQFYGLDADKVLLAREYLPTLPAQLYYGEDGLLYGPDLENFFVGDPATENGYVCGTGAILSAAQAYLADQGSSLQALDFSGARPEDLYRLIHQDTPALVWVTIAMEEREPTEGWYTEDGQYQEWSVNDHGAVLIGYTEDTVLLADPLAGLAEYSRSAFESVYASRGSRCVILR